MYKEDGGEGEGERRKEGREMISRATTPSPLVHREGKYVYDGIETYFLSTQNIQYLPVKEAVYIVHTDNFN